MRTSSAPSPNLQLEIGKTSLTAAFRPVSPLKKIAQSSPTASPDRPCGRKIV